MAGTLVYERKNELLEGLFFLFFLFQKYYNGMAKEGQEENEPFYAARSYRQYLKPEILICRICAGNRNFSLRGDTGGIRRR